MKVLVTGSNGFLGRALVGRLLAHGVADIRCLIRQDSYRTRFDPADRQALDFMVGNLLSRDDARRSIEGVDVICHLAASLKGSPADMFLNTVVASNNLLSAIAGCSPVPKTVLVSSMGVYGVADLPAGSLIDENAPLEPHPEQRDVYSHAKWRQERLFREFAERASIPLTVLRPGVIYGPGGSPFSARVGLSLFGLFLYMGGSSELPLTYVENCAEAIALASLSDDATGRTYNVVDDNPPTAKQYFRRYRKEVRAIPYVRIPYAGMVLVSRLVQGYNRRSHGQLPAVFTPYKTRSIWKGFHFTNSELKRLGWRQIVSSEEGLARTFAYLKDNSQGGAH